jgi:mitochondrial fission protein ELM1
MGNRAGDNNQLLALAHALGWPFETKKIEYNALRRFPLLRRGMRSVRRDSRELVRPPWPDLILCVGYASVPVARFIRGRTGGRAKLVHIGNPRGRLPDFDLQITTPQYSRRAANLLELPFPIGNPAKNMRAEPEELEWLDSLLRPLRLVAVGGPARHWQLDDTTLLDAIRTLQAKGSGSVIVATSPRTSRSTRALLSALGDQIPLVHRFPRFGVLLAYCDEVHVTADSVSMLAEAILSGKPVGMIPIKRSALGRFSHWAWERPTGRSTVPDFRNFWRLLERCHFVGSVEHPVAGHASDTIEPAVNAVRQLLS